MTTLQRAPDWKVTPGYRLMLGLGWACFTLALYVAAIALVLDFAPAWWISGLLALLALAASVFLPEPLPADMITGGHNHIGPR